MIASSSAITTRTATKGPPLPAVGQQAVEELVLGLLESLDGLHQLGPAVGNGVGVLLGVVMLAIGERRLRDERAQAGLVGRLGEEGHLLVDDRQVGAQPLEALSD